MPKFLTFYIDGLSKHMSETTPTERNDSRQQESTPHVDCIIGGAVNNENGEVDPSSTTDAGCSIQGTASQAVTRSRTGDILTQYWLKDNEPAKLPVMEGDTRRRGYAFIRNELMVLQQSLYNSRSFKLWLFCTTCGMFIGIPFAALYGFPL